MDLKIFSYVFIVLAMMAFIMALDYRDDYIRGSEWFTNKAALRYCRTVRMRMRKCFLWSALYAVLALAFWCVEYFL